MRLLHTSDWHLGAALESVSRDPDHGLFLDWLLATVEREAVDVLIVAGDVFDLAQPSAEAQRLYYRFLARAAQTRLARVVVIGGNHDSASRLDAPQELLGALKIHVVGGLDADPERWRRCLCPIRATEDGPVQAVVVAVPFVHEYRLGVRSTQGTPQELKKALRLAFTRLYKSLADHAAGRWPGVPLIATGHLTASGAQRDDYGTPLHQVQHAGTLPASIFDRRFDYVALGHIHRAFPIEDRPVWYCGSPIPLRLKEAETPRHVILVDVAAGEPARVTPIEVPRGRDLVALEGPLAEVEAALVALRSDAPLPPLVYARVKVDGYDPTLQATLQAALDRRPADVPRPILVSVRQDRPEAPAEPDAVSPVALPRLRDLAPEEVFRRLCDVRGESVDGPLLNAFRSLIATTDEALAPAPERRAAPRQGSLLPESTEP